MEAEIISGVQPDTRTIHDLQKNGYTGLEPQLTKDILYLDQLSTTTSQPIRKWPVVEMLRNVERGNKRAINKLFFDHIETDKKEVIGKMDADTFQKVQRVMFESAERIKKADLDQVKYDLSNRRNNLVAHMRRVNETVSSIRQSIDRIDQLENLTPTRLTAGFEEILENPFWVFERVAFNKAYFKTAAEVVIRHQSPSSGIDMQVNFGTIGIVLDFSAPDIHGVKKENNLVLKEGYFHPFISSSGEICYGNHGDEAYRMLAEYDFGKLFDLTAALLTSYHNSGNPYVALATFYDREIRKNGIKRETPVTCDGCKLPEESCSCIYCELCDLKGSHKTTKCLNYCDNCGMNIQNCGCEQEEEEEDEVDESDELDESDEGIAF